MSGVKNSFHNGELTKEKFMLSVVSLEEAKRIILESGLSFERKPEKVKLSEAVGRILFYDICSCENIPAFNRSTVDGFAVKASDTFGSSESIPAQLTVKGEILMGEEAAISISEGECVRISTGGMLPEGADAVVMVENTDCSFDEFCLCFKSVSPFENVTRKGDDLKEGQLILKKGTLLSSKHIGVLAAIGIGNADVVQKIRVGIISTGDELVPVEEKLTVGKIRDINTHMLMSLITEMGCVAQNYGIIGDSFREIYSAVKKAAEENDMVLISGGSSAGVKDMTVKVISELGKVDFHGIALKPGKPTIYGTVNGKAVFGLPGNPAAAYYVTLLTVKPLAEKLYSKEKNERTAKAKISKNISSNHGREEVLSVKIKGEYAVPVYAKSAFVGALSESDGYIIIDRNSEGLKENEVVTVYLL